MDEVIIMDDLTDQLEELNIDNESFVTIKVNNNKEYKIKISIYDTIETFKYNICEKIGNTELNITFNIFLVNYERLSNIYQTNDIVHVYSLPNLYTKEIKTFFDFYKITRELETYYKNNFNFEYLSQIQNILKVWCLSDTQNLEDLINIPELRNVFFMTEKFTDELQDDYNTNKTDLKNILNSLKDLKNNFKVEYDSKVNIYNKILEDIENFSNIPDKIDIKDFEIEKKRITYKIKEKYSLLQIFNNIKLNENILFCATNNYYKIYNNLDNKILNYFQNDFVSNENSDYIVIYAKTLIKTNYKNMDRNFTNIILYLDDVDDIIIEYDFIKHSKYFSEEQIENILFESLQIQNTGTKNINNISGYFIIPNMNFNQYVLADICMNSPIINRYFIIDEENQAHKKGPNDRVYMFLKTDIINKKIGATISNSNNEYSIRIKVFSVDKLNIINNMYLSYIIKLFSFYKENKDNVISIYRNYITNFDKDTKIIVKKTKTKLGYPHEENSKWYFKGYPRQCEKRRQPNVINKETASQLPDNEKLYYLDQWYSCNHNEKHIFPDLMKNKGKNQEKYPVVPCCFTKKQTNKKVDIKFNDRIIITNKYLRRQDQPGILPKNILRLFNIYSFNISCYRIGMTRSYNSFLECLIKYESEINSNIKKKIIDMKNNNLDNYTAHMIDYLNTRRSQLLENNEHILNICRQQNYDISFEQLKSNVINNNTYLDPRLYITLLEYIFNVKIYLFSNRDNKDGNIVIPNYKNGFLKSYNIYKRSIIVYENWGSEDDNLLYPQCELVIYNDGPLENINSYDYDVYLKNQKISEGDATNFEKNKKQLRNELSHFYIKFTASYQLNNLIKRFRTFGIHNNKTNVPFLGKNIFLSDNIISQYIDIYGKTRYIKFIYNENIISLITSPLPPLPVKIESIDQFTIPNNYEIIQKFINDTDKKIISQYIDNQNKCVEINIKSNEKYDSNIIFTAKIFEIKPIENIKNENESQISNSNISYLQTYQRNKKTSLCVLEYIYKYFSIYIKENNITKDYKKYITDFFEKHTIEIKGYEYPDISINFSNEIIKDNKVIIGSNDPTEFSKRLKYNLLIEIQNNIKKLLSYHNSQYINNYFNNFNNFKLNNNQTLLNGFNSLKSWIKEKVDDNYIYNYLYINKKEKEEIINKNIYEEGNIDIEKFKEYIDNQKPYFLKQKENTYIIQENSEIVNALYKNEKWQNDHYNPHINIDDIIYTSNLKESYDLYAYKNLVDKKIYKINGGDINNKIFIYKKNGLVRYLSTLKL